MRVGEELRGYRIVSRLGQGGMGIAWKAETLGSEHMVVVKSLHSAGGDPSETKLLRLRLKREAKILMRLEHEHIVRAREWFESNGEVYLVLEHIQGPTFKAWLEGDAAPRMADRVRALRQIAAALEYAHAVGVTHRDLKPSNIMIAPGPCAKVLDFGLAAAVGSTRLTRTGAVMGTLAYMAPEQARGQRVDARADVYALGMLLAFALGLSAPFRRRSATSAYARLLSPAPVVFDDWLPRALRRQLERLVDKDPAKRTPSAEAAGAILDELLADGQLDDVLAEARTSSMRAPSSPPRLPALERPELFAKLGELMARSGSGGGGSLLVLGASGVGRSDALSVAAERLAAAGVDAIQLCFVRGGLPHLVLDAYGVEWARLRAWSEPTAEHAPRDPVDEPQPEPLRSEAQRIAGFVAAVAASARRRPQALLLDDIQHATESEYRWLEQLLRLTQEVPLLLILAADLAPEEAGNAARSEVYAAFLGRLASDARMLRLELETFSDEDVARALAEAGIPERVATRVISLAGGKPGTINLLLGLWHDGDTLEGLPSRGPLEQIERLRSRWLLLDDLSRRVMLSLVEAGGSLSVDSLGALPGASRLRVRARLRELATKHAWLYIKGDAVQLSQPLLAVVVGTPSDHATTADRAPHERDQPF